MVYGRGQGQPSHMHTQLYGMLSLHNPSTFIPRVDAFSQNCFWHADEHSGPASSCAAAAAAEAAAATEADDGLWEGAGAAPMGLARRELLLSERALLVEARRRVEWHEALAEPETDAQQQHVHNECVSTLACGTKEWNTILNVWLKCRVEYGMRHSQNQRLTRSRSVCTMSAFSL